MLKKLYLSIAIVSCTFLYGMSVDELNSGSKERLMQIKGVGSAKADAIIEYRKTTTFNTIDDVTNIKGIGAVLAKNIKDDIKDSSKIKKEIKEQEVKELNTTKDLNSSNEV
jgi:competence protein ComEA